MAETAARDYNADFDTYGKWDDYYNELKKTHNDDAIRKALTGTRWDDEKGAPNAYKFIHPNKTRTPDNSIGVPSASQPYSTNPNKSPYTQPLSIMDAYYAGKFGDRDSDIAKRNRNYFLADQFGTFARNLGKDIGNVGAQFSGGTIDNNRDASQWDTRNENILREETSADIKNVGGSDAAMNAASSHIGIQSGLKGLQSQEMANHLESLKQVPANMWADLINNADVSSPTGVIQKALGTVMLDNSVNGRKVDIPTILATLGATGTNEIEKAAQAEGKDVPTFVVDKIKELTGEIQSKVGDGINVNLNTGLGGNKETVTGDNPFNVAKSGPFSKGNDPYDTMRNMQSKGFLDNTPYENRDFSDAYAFAKKYEGYDGAKDDHFTDWLYKRFKDREQRTYGDEIKAPGSNN